MSIEVETDGCTGTDSFLSPDIGARLLIGGHLIGYPLICACIYVPSFTKEVSRSIYNLYVHLHTHTPVYTPPSVYTSSRMLLLST